MNTKGKKNTFTLTGILLAILFAVNAMAGVPVITDVMVTDVTTRSFSVIWASNEASRPSLSVFDDSAGLIPAVGIQVIAQPVKNNNPSIQTAAEDQGVMKVEVTGLSFDTTYYYQTITTSKSSNDITTYPLAGPLPPVTTQSLTVRTVTDSDEIPFSNDLIVLDCFLPDGITPAQGTLLVAQVSDGNYPISEFVGDSVVSPGACVDLNNIFSDSFHQNIQLLGGESLTLIKYMGIHGIESKEYMVPVNNQLAQIKSPDPALFYGDFDTDNDVDGDDLIIFISEFNICTLNCMADFEPDSDVDADDLAQFAAAFGKTGL